MKLMRFNGGRVGVVRGDRVVDATAASGVDPSYWPPVGMIRLIADFERCRAALDAVGGDGVPISSVTIETPVPWPNKLIAYPANYHDHAIEMNNTQYRASSRGFFLKSASSLSGVSDGIVLPEPLGREIHHEAELAVVIGKGGRFISRDDALSHIFGYSCLLDITVRGLEIERVTRKSYDTFTPVGPWLVTADEIPEPGKLDMKLWVNDELRQHANTAELVLDIAGQIELASAVMTLEPGDIIATGTCAGVGPIAAGDTVTIEIEHVGRMTVPVIQGEGGANIAMPAAGSAASG